MDTSTVIIVALAAIAIFIAARTIRSIKRKSKLAEPTKRGNGRNTETK